MAIPRNHRIARGILPLSNVRAMRESAPSNQHHSHTFSGCTKTPHRSPQAAQQAPDSPKAQARPPRKPVRSAPRLSHVPLHAARRRRRRPRREPDQNAPPGPFILAPFSLPLHLHVHLLFSPRPTPCCGGGWRERRGGGGVLPPSRRPKPPRVRPARRTRRHG